MLYVPLFHQLPSEMKVAKTFRWEAAHRLPMHPGLCRNLHGHSYRMTVILDGPVGPDEMVIDFGHIKSIVSPLVNAWDHATLVSEDDVELLDLVTQLESKHFLVPGQTTVENLCRIAAEAIEEHGKELLVSHAITNLTVRIHETETCYSEIERAISPE